MRKVTLVETVYEIIPLQVNPSDVIILEGILVFHDSRVREMMNMKIFVDTGYFLSPLRRLYALHFLS